MKMHFQNMLKGAAMGIAEVIPGVSGGTIAFITGIYEKLINTIKAFGPGLFGTLKNDGVAGVWEEVNGTFLLSLLAGMAVGMITGVFGITYLLETVPVLVWAFFFGLIIASAIYIGRQLDVWRIQEIAALLIGIVVAYGITVISPTEGSTALPFVFLSGMIAISALILPGISGSFILLLMGMYTIVIPTVKTVLKTLDPASLLIVGTFALGCLVGLMTFSRVLSWAFKNYRNPVLALLTGFMIGSLNKIWPWRIPTDWLRDETGAVIMEEGVPKKILAEDNVLPWNYGEEAFFVAAIVLMAVGFIAVFLIEKLGSSKQEEA